MEILFRCFYPDHHEENDWIKQRLDKALSELSKLDTIPTSKEELDNNKVFNFINEWVWNNIKI